MTVRDVRETWSDGEFFYDEDMDVRFVFNGTELRVHGTTVTEGGPVTIEMKEAKEVCRV